MIAEVKCIAKGKVRTLYACDLHPDVLLFVASDRISAYDVVLESTVPHKGHVLTALSQFWFKRIQFKHHFVTATVNEMPLVFRQFAEAQKLDSNAVMLVKRLRVVPIEAIVRGYLSGSAFTAYTKNGADLVDELKQVPRGLRESAQLSEPLFTPSTKAEQGHHDENISFEHMCELLQDRKLATQIKAAALQLYNQAAEYALTRNIIIADTKFEFGVDQSGELHLIDEVLTPDSSRFWPAANYAEGRPQQSLDKQYVRDYLTSIKFNKRDPVALPMEVIQATSDKYLQVHKMLTGADLLAK